VKSRPLRSLLQVCPGLFILLVAIGAKAQEPGTPDRIEPGQTLEEFAEKHFGNPAVADELRALNGIPAGKQPESNDRLRLPGPERDQVVTALRVASQALAQAKADGAEQFAPEKLQAAIESMNKAEKSMSSAKYAQCRKMADETWALARIARTEALARQPKKNRFSVSVDTKGTTRVEVMEGDGVKVTSGKKSTTVKRGHAVKVNPGKPPEKVQPLLPPPVQVLPNNASVLVTPSIYFNWKPVQNANRYVLLISEDPSGLRPIRQMTTSKPSYLFRSSLPDGKYYWLLRTVDTQGLVGRVSPPRYFILQTSTDGGLTVEPVENKIPREGD
jgi:hypothetical protein